MYYVSLVTRSIARDESEMIGRLRNLGAVKYLAWFLAIALASILSWSALTAYEFLALGLYPVREEPPVFTTYFLLRSLFALAIAGTLVSVLILGAADTALCRGRLTITQRTLAPAAMLTGLGLTAVFLSDPVTFLALAE